jgi:PAS domain S-box-containing protein
MTPGHKPKGVDPRQPTPHEQEVKYRLLVNSVRDYAIIVLDAGGRILTWNTGAEQLAGYHPSEVVGRHFSVFYPPDDVKAGRPEQALRTATVEGRVEDEGWRVRGDGSRFWANVVLTALRDPHGTLIGFGEVTRDLTERRREEDKLRRSEERFRLLVEGVTDYAIFMLDPEGRVLSWNAGAERIKGYRPEEILGEHFARFFPPEEVAAGKPAELLRAAASQGQHEDEGWRLRKDGSRFWANAVLTAIRDEHGALTGFAKVVRDLTERRLAEEALRSAEEYVRLVVEGAYSAFVGIDSTGLITGWNRQSEVTFGWPREEAVGRELAETIIPPQYREAHRHGLQRFLATGEGPVLNRVLEMTALRRDGTEFPVELTIAPLRLGGKLVFAAFLRDITERKEVEDERKRHAAALEAANAELEGFSYSVSHDLRAPLRAIDGYAQALLEDHATALDAEGQRLLGVVRENAQRMGQLIDGLLKFSRFGRQAMSLTPLDMTALARAVVDEVRQAGDRGAAAPAVALEELPPALGDQTLVRQVLANLIGNAVKFSRTRPRPEIRVGGRSEGDEVVYFVQDNGVGFDMRYADKLFQVFGRLHKVEEFEGTGVGLALTQRIVQRHGGRVWVESAPDQGAKFYFSLPVTAT